MPFDKNTIRCTGCKKVIGELDYLNDGKISIKCKCGVLNTIEAAPKQQFSTSGLNLGIFSIQHISTGDPELKVQALAPEII